MIRVLIVDDEPLARDTVALVLARDPDVAIVGSCTGTDAPRLASELRPDVMFVDVEMPERDGFEVVAALELDPPPAIVFVTAYDTYAVRAFEIHAIDYVLKPFDDRRLLGALARVKQHAPERAARIAAMLDERERARPVLERFVVRGRDRTTIVKASDVDWLEAADDYVELHVGATVHIIRERMAALETRLDPARFVRIHRSTIVNLERVRELRPLVRGDAEVVLDDGTALRLARSRRTELAHRLAGSPQRTGSSPQMR